MSQTNCKSRTESLSKRRVNPLVYIICVLAVISFLACSSGNLNINDDNSFILLMDTKRYHDGPSYIYNLNSNNVTKIYWQSFEREPYFASKYRADTILIYTVDNNQPDSIFNSKDQIHTFYKYVPGTNFIKNIENISKYNYDVYSLLYDGKSNKYLYLFKNEKGQHVRMILNSSFDSVGCFFNNDLNIYNSDEFPIHDIFFSSKGVLLTTYDNGYKSYFLTFDDIFKHKSTIEFNGRVLCLSNNDNMVLYLDEMNKFGTNIKQNPTIYNFLDSSFIKIDLGEEIIAACFSPNDKYIAFTKRTNNLLNDVILCIYDIESKKIFESDFSDARNDNIVWLQRN